MGGAGLAQQIELPPYTKGEEIFNWVSHLVGFLLAVSASIITLPVAINTGKATVIVAMAIYCFTIIVQYAASTIYHGLPPEKFPKLKKAFRLIDHYCVFLFIAGTVTPYALIALGESWVGYTWLSVVWIIAIIGRIFKTIGMKRFNNAARICSAAMGLSILCVIAPLLKSIGIEVLSILLFGAFFYIIGLVLYELGRTKRYAHGVWHLCVLAGSFIQFFAIWYYLVLPAS